MTDNESATGAGAWTLLPGDQVERKKLHADFGGRTQGGIGPSRQSPNVFVFTDPIAGEKHGYYDGWMADGLFHYSGEGQFGDQRMLSGNASILKHRQEGRALRLFQGARGIVTYLGEFEVDGDDPWYEADAPETGGGPLRKVIVFRLRPVDAAVQPPQTSLARLIASSVSQVEQIPIEQQLTEKSFVNPAEEPYEAERREARLVQELGDHLRRRQHSVQRHQILPPGETRPLFTDLYDDTLDLLVEAKGSVTRENVRMALGQLADYQRFVQARRRAILMPSKPRADLVDLAQSQLVAIIWPAERGYQCTDPDLKI